jgi:hypothetical protein
MRGEAEREIKLESVKRDLNDWSITKKIVNNNLTERLHN